MSWCYVLSLIRLSSYCGSVRATRSKGSSILDGYWPLLQMHCCFGPTS